MTNLPAARTGTTLVEADQWEADALAAIDAVATPEAAEALLGKIKLADQAVRLSKLGAEREQRWGRVRVLAERRYGELLPPPKSPAEAGAVRGTHSSDTERQAQRQARAVAAVPEPVFKEYIETAPQPTRAGLLREAGERPADTMDRLKAAASSGDPDAERAVVEYRDSRILLNFGKALTEVTATIVARDNTLDAITRMERRRAEELLRRCESVLPHISAVRDALADYLAPGVRRVK